MMEPRIQYAKTKDGVNIAFWAMGEGIPVVLMPGNVCSHVQLEWQIPQYRRWFELVTEKHKLIRYDGRGTGLSDRDATDFSLDGQISDLEAVLDRLALERVALFATLRSGPVAITYAAHSPEKVSHLVLWQSFARGAEYFDSPQVQAVYSLIERDWDMFIETAMHISFGWAEGDFSHRMAGLMRESVTREAAKAALAATKDDDAAPFLKQVRCPTLVVQVRQAPYPSVDVARRLAAAIPDARLTLFEGESVALLGDQEARAAILDEFLGEGAEASDEAKLPEGTAIILFADIADSTALTERLGDAAFRAKAGELDGLLRNLIRDAGGTPVEGKVLGDGVMAVFSSARQAIDCALRCRTAGDESSLPLHLGIHAGDVLREGNTVYGGAVNLAQRITDASAPGEILVSDTLRGLARTSTDVGFEDRGERELKGIEEPQRLWAVREQEED